MIWQLYATISVISLGLAIIAQKIVLKNRDAITTTWIFMSIAALSLLPLLNFSEIFMPRNLIILVIGSGIIYTAAQIFGSISYQKADISLIAPIKNFSPILVLFLSFIFLKEAITIQKVIGIILIVTGAIGLENIKTPFQSLKKISLNKGVQYAFMVMLLLSLAHIIDKYLLYYINPEIFSIIIYLIIAGILSIYSLGTRRIGEGIKILKTVPILIFLAGFFEAFSFYFQMITLKMIDASVFVPIRRTYTLVVIFLAYFILKEGNIKNKLFGTIIMLLGLSVLYFI